MLEPLVIQSYKGPYTVFFEEEAFAVLTTEVSPNSHFLIDARVAELYSRELQHVLSAHSVLRIEATEHNKSLDKFTDYVEHLAARKIRRGDLLVAVGGGIIQDITSFLASTLFRGLNWHFYPTTLLAQADSCIGSKSSINVGRVKNVLGSFAPPKRAIISSHFLRTLDEREIHSGVGEMLKVHAIEGPESFDRIAADYRKIFHDKATLSHYIRRSLEIKKQIVEQDEFDNGIRNIMNYGHTFGHAIESATNFVVPHGIAVTIGMDMANYTAMRLDLCGKRHYERMHPILAANYKGYEDLEIPLEPFFSAISKDKKNTSEKLRLILPDASAHVSPHLIPDNTVFHDICTDYLLRGHRR